ncbi:hypothetical protein ACFQV4_29175 [Streptomyces thermocarboxydus]
MGGAGGGGDKGNGERVRAVLVDAAEESERRNRRRRSPGTVRRTATRSCPRHPAWPPPVATPGGGGNGPGSQGHHVRRLPGGGRGRVGHRGRRYAGRHRAMTAATDDGRARAGRRTPLDPGCRGGHLTGQDRLCRRETSGERT